MHEKLKLDRSVKVDGNLKIHQQMKVNQCLNADQREKLAHVGPKYQLDQNVRV